MTQERQDQLADGSYEFLAIFLEGLPFIFLGTLVSGLIDLLLEKFAQNYTSLMLNPWISL